MGRTKQLLPWQTASGDLPLVAAAFDAVQPICDAMIVVLGHESAAVATALGDRPFHPVTGDADAPMFDSIRLGLHRAREINPAATVVLQPGDHPEVSLATLDALTAAAAAHPQLAILPKYQGRGGHPVMIPPSIVARIVNDGCPNGLAQFWRDHSELCHRLTINDAGIVHDIDTPTDLRTP
jgi:molybdenum cofactor cytidylyltransferase